MMFQQSLFNSKLNTYYYVQNINEELEKECSRIINRFISAYSSYNRNRQNYFGKNSYSIKLQYDCKNISKDTILNNHIISSYICNIADLNVNIINCIISKIHSEYFVIKVKDKLVLQLKQDTKERITKELTQLCN